jgi:2,3-bisphosphoglycerate-dependent phosphoglycerate mutase
VTTLTLLRHGESVWNREKRFTGWTDVELTPRGTAQAEDAGRLLASRGFTFDLAFTSMLRRATETLRIVLETMDQTHVPVRESWCLNERHYGALQGLSRWEAIRKYGARRMFAWQRHFAIPPPPVDVTDARFPGQHPRYAALADVELPRTESLQDTLMRLLPYWESTIAPELRAGKRVLVVAHHNTLRALVKHLDGIADGAVVTVRIPTGKPLVYELGDDLRVVRRSYLEPSRRGTGATG